LAATDNGQQLILLPSVIRQSRNRDVNNGKSRGLDNDGARAIAGDVGEQLSEAGSCIAGAFLMAGSVLVQLAEFVAD
jgi:hypothetical protein